MRKVVLCADGESLGHPELLGLGGENLPKQEWLKPVSHALEARQLLLDTDDVEEVWVASSDEMDPINLAAALKHDTHGRPVYLLGANGNGSLRSRANCAGIDGVIDTQELARRYANRKAQQRGVSSLVASAQRARAASLAAQGEEGRALGAASETERHNAFATKPLHPAVDVTGVWPKGMSSLTDRPKEMRTSRKRGESAVDGQVTAPVMEAAEGSEAAEARPQSKVQVTRLAPRAPAVERGGAYVLTVVSASGGTGKSTVAVLSALIAQSLGHRTLLLDADLQFGDAAQLLAEKDPLRIDQVIRDPSKIDQLAVRADKPTLLAAPAGVEDSEELVGCLDGLLDKLCDRFDVIVVNTGSFWLEEHIKLLEFSSNTLFLVDQRPTSLKAIKRALELCARCGVASTPFLFAVNRCTKNGMLTSLDISCALNGARVVELRDGGREVEELMGAGMPHELLRARNALCLSLQAFLVDVLPEASARDASKERSSQPRRLMSFKRKKRRA